MMKKLAKIKISEVDGDHLKTDAEFAESMSLKQSVMVMVNVADALHTMIDQIGEHIEGGKYLTELAVDIVKNGYGNIGNRTNNI